MVSLTKKAEKTPATSTMPESRTRGAMGVLHHPGADGGEESGEAEIGDDDHHAEEQHDGVVIDGGVGLLHGEDVEGEHEAGADDGRAGAVHAEERDASDGEDEVGGGEDEYGG